MAGLRSRSVVVVCLTMVVVLAASGCGSAVHTGLSGQELRIGFVMPNTTFHFAREMGEGFRAGARITGGVEATVVGPRMYDGVQQRALFEQLATQAKGGIAVAPSASALFSAPLAEASAEGIPLVACGGLPLPGSGVRLLVENDNYELGRMLGAEVIKRLAPQTTGTVILGSNTPSLPALDQRGRGIRDLVATALPAVRVLGPFDTQRDLVANVGAWKTLAEANPDAVALLGMGDVDAVTLARLRPEMAKIRLAGGFSVEPPVLQGVRDGRRSAVVSPEHFLKGVMMGWLLAERARNARPLPEGWLVAPGLLVNSANVEAIMHRQSSQAIKLAWFSPVIQRITAEPTPLLRPLQQAR